MPNATAIAPHLPGLRRFARLLTGGQNTGDACVAATLEAMAAEAVAAPSGESPRVELYRNLLKVCRPMGLMNLAPEAGETGETVSPGEPEPRVAERKLATITPGAREAFLLVAVEEFTPEEAAAVLECSTEEVERLASQAGREIAEMVATKVVIIEDEPLIAMDIERVVEDLGHQVCHVARTHKQAVAMVRAHRPGLVLADIELADGSSGLEAVNEIVKNFEVPVVFVTAYPERLLTGDRPEPTFLITKPFQPNALKAVVSQALFFDAKARPQPSQAARA